MTTLFDVGDTIELTIRGTVHEYSKGQNGDCYTIQLLDNQSCGPRVYLDTESLIISNAKKVKQ